MKDMIKSTIVILITLVLFSTAVYAWFIISDESIIQEVNTEIVKREVNLDVEYGINGGGYSSFDEPATINSYLSAMLPGDSINIKVNVENANLIGDPDMQIEIVLDNIRSGLTDIEYDLTDFFYIDNGQVILTWYASAQDLINENAYSNNTIVLNTIDPTMINYLGYDLQTYRMSNIFDYSINGQEMVIGNDITIFETSIPSQHILTIEFSITLDPYTPDFGTGFQDGELLIDGLYSLISEG